MKEEYTDTKEFPRIYTSDVEEWDNTWQMAARCFCLLVPEQLLYAHTLDWWKNRRLHGGICPLVSYTVCFVQIQNSKGRYFPALFAALLWWYLYRYGYTMQVSIFRLDGKNWTGTWGLVSGRWPIRLTNEFMAAKKHHPFLKIVISK